MASLLEGCGMFRDFETPCGDADYHPIENGNDEKIEYVISTLTYYAPSQDHVETPCAVVDKVKKAFELYESIEEFPYQFDFKGFYNPSIEPESDRPLIKVDLTGTTVTMPSARDGVADAVPTHSGYRGGAFYLNTAEGLDALDFTALLHELGHALGLSHVPSNAAVMSAGVPMWDGEEYYHLSMQDRANLIGAWAPLDEYYEVYGSVQGSSVQGHTSYYVFVVDVVTGTTFSSVTGPDYDYATAASESFAFSVTIPARLVATGVLSGRFKVFVKGYEQESLDITDPVVMPSWYVNDVTATIDPDNATEIEFTPDNRAQNIILQTVETRNTFAMFWAERVLASDDLPSFLLPGSTGRVMFRYSAADIASAAFFGSDPGINFANFAKGRDLELDRPLTNAYMADFAVAAGAQPGPKLVRLVDYDGNANYGLVGIEVLSGTAPESLTGSSYEDQFAGKRNFRPMNPNYWKDQ